MRFVSFAGEDGRARAGVLLPSPASSDAIVLDGGHPVCRERLGGLAPDMQAWIEAGLQAVGHRLLEDPPAAACRPLSALRLLAPLPRPGKIVGAAFNYVDALAERSMAHPAEPVIFVKSGRTVVGPGEPVVLGTALADVTYEAELAVVIGTPALKVARAQALSHVCAYTLFNDVSVTSMVKADGGFVRGKNQPTTGPLGPWLVTPDEIADPMALPIRLDVDGTRLQDSATSQMLFDIAQLIEYASARMPLDPGDVIATGTPAGVAGAHRPARWLVPGNMVTLCIDGIGELSNPVVAGSPT
ncbi:fumarylacetoacetate hydrolase family protein [Bordetella sp. 2513F-2]